MGQAESRTHIPESNNLIPRASYEENRAHFNKIKDDLIDEWQNEEYPVWILIFHPEKDTKIFFSANDVENSIYNSEHAYVVKIPVEKPTQPVSRFLEKVSNILGEFVNVLTSFDEPPFMMTNTLLKPIPIRPKKLTKKRNYEFLYDQDFHGIEISLAVVLDGRLIGIQEGKTRKFEWLIKNPNHTEIQYNLLLSQ